MSVSDAEATKLAARIMTAIARSMVVAVMAARGVDAPEAERLLLEASDKEESYRQAVLKKSNPKTEGVK